MVRRSTGEADVRSIQLTRGHVAQVDDEDFERINQHKWYADFDKHTQSFYARRRTLKTEGRGRRSVRMHREVMRAPEGQEVDHVNHDTLDNQKSNLRLCSTRQNQGNVRLPSDNTSGFKGVYWYKRARKWVAHIGVSGRRVTIGAYSTPADAAKAYDAAAISHFGEFAHTNRSMGLLK